ncbi:MAG: LysM peptidoglycan-binding domain-containing protein [Planctomycetaceae bacterium]
MATSDKDTHRGDASRDSHQSSQPAGEAAGGSVAASPVNLNPFPARSIRHETWLGICVVMLLVFALGFLVYQKVERHERQLTQAAIASPNAEPPEVADTQPIAAAATDAELVDAGAADPESAATDPLNAATISDVSPFLEPPAAQAGEPTAGQPADAAPVFAFSEPAEDMAAAPDLLAAATIEPTADVAAAGPELPGISDGETAPSPADTSGAAEPLELLAPLESSLEPSAGAAVESPAAEVMLAEAVPALPESDSGNPFNTPESPSAPELTLAPEQAENPLTISPVDNSPAVAAEEPAPPLPAAADPEPVMEPAAEPAGPQLPEFSFSPDAAEAAAAVAPADGEPMSEVTVVPDQPAAEPQLLALAEPQFSPGGATFTEPAPPSAAFRAVTRPGTGSRMGSGGAAGGSAGADRDGRFSLAAFNTQNAAVAAGVDDGEKHKSVIVQNGENYSKISKRVYGTTRYFSALAVFNQHRIPNPNSMRPGMIVLTPDAKLLEERYPQLFIDRQPKVEQPAGFLLLDDGSPAYRVGARETLSEISERFLGRSTRWVEIYELNRSVLADPNTLKPGLVLALPEDATEVQLVP